MIKEWLQLYHARSWMNRNKSFLPTWHAYTGYTLGLFDMFASGERIETIANQEKLDVALLTSWVDVGVIIGHLSKSKDGTIIPSTYIMTYIARSSEYSVGALLKEMMELHIPTLLHYPRMLRGESKMTYQDEHFGATVAETSSYLEKLAFPKLEASIKKYAPQKILDVGCGYAGYLIRLAKKFPDLHFVGIEKNHQVSEKAKANIVREGLQQIDIIESDIEEWNATNESIDFIMLNNILYYFNDEQRHAIFHRIHQLLKPKGTLSIISPLHPSKKGKSFSSAFNIFMTSHVNLYALPSEDELHSMAHQHGFKFQDIQPIVKEGSWYYMTLVKV
jgi:cyclopropane fatty-acyl-phospholipid synthase-like methyltransferase